MRTQVAAAIARFAAIAGVVALAAQAADAAQAPTSASSAPPVTAAHGADALESEYVIGPDDLLTIVFWRDRDMSGDVTVRPDGKITVPLLNDVQAAGYTPEQLRAEIVKAAASFLEDPSATVVVREVRSRKVFITGNVTRPAAYVLTGDITVLQLIALAGGLLEFADSKNIVVIRKEAKAQRYFRVNYNELIRRKNIAQNITLRAGDTVVVP